MDFYFVRNSMKVFTKSSLALTLSLLLPAAALAETQASSPAPVPAATRAPAARAAARPSASLAEARSLIITLQGYGEELEPPDPDVFKKLQSRISPVISRLRQEGRAVDAKRLAQWNQSVAKQLYTEDSEAYKTAARDMKLASSTLPLVSPAALKPGAKGSQAGENGGQAAPVTLEDSERQAAVQRETTRKSVEEYNRIIQKLFPGKY